MLAIKSLIKSKIAPIKWQDIADSILGRDYDLSLVFIGDTKSKKLNQIHRQKNKVANVLSFPLTKKAGEIFLNPKAAEREAKIYDETIKNRLIYLFIHGVLHLKGFDHGSKMDAKEKHFSQIFIKHNVKTNHHRARRRIRNH